MDHRRFDPALMDDVAIFVDDTFEPAVARRLCGDSPSALAMLSPQPHEETCSVRRVRRPLLHDLTNAADAKQLKSPGVGRTAAVCVHAATSPAWEAGVPRSDLEAVAAERDRFRDMYEHQRALTLAAEQQLEETEGKLQAKIVEAISIGSRHDEAKRFIRQLKRELLECKERALPLHNAPFHAESAAKAAELRTQKLLREQERQYAAVVQEQEERVQSLEDVVHDLRGADAADVLELLPASYSRSARLAHELGTARRRLDAAHDEAASLRDKVDRAQREHDKIGAAAAAERRELHAAAARDQEYIEELERAVQRLRRPRAQTPDESTH